MEEKTSTEEILLISSAPHIKSKDTTQKIMFGVVISLIPALIGSIYFFGIRALWLTVFSIITAVSTEWIIQKLRKVEITVSDGSAIVTGILLAFNLPAGVPWWIPVIGSFFSIAIAKQTFGGLGFNPMNPALLGRAFLLASWPVHMTTDWTAPLYGTKSGISIITTATPLAVLKDAIKNLSIEDKAVEAAQTIITLKSSYANLFWGRVGGCIGETSVILLLIGAGYLLYKRYINLRIPLSYIATVALLTWAFGGPKGYFTGDPLFHVLAGGLILGAFFMATDMVTSPCTSKGQWIFGFGCGLFTVIIRLVGGYPEGVSYSILLMNIMTPLLDRHLKNKPFGG